MNTKIKLEIVCGNVDSIIAAQQGGADRVELCDNLAEGGTTPGYGMIEMARRKLFIALHIMIRPRGGDFLYTHDEFDIMKRDIEVCKKLKADGVVFGLLNDDGSVDKNRTKELVELSKPLSVTFHRAFDMTNEPLEALEEIIECGCHRILTSGVKPSAIEGAETISQLIKQASGRIIIMPGGGIRPENVTALIAKTKATEIHSSARKFKESKMKFKSNAVQMDDSSTDEFKIFAADVQVIKELKAAIHLL